MDLLEVRQRVGANLRRYRHLKGWTIEGCARRLNVAVTTWQRWEGARTSPEMDNLNAAAALLGVTPADLLK